MELSATLIPREEGGFTAICNEARGAIAQGETEEEALNNLKDAILEIPVAMAKPPNNKPSIDAASPGDGGEGMGAIRDRPAGMNFDVHLVTGLEPCELE